MTVQNSGQKGVDNGDRSLRLSGITRQKFEDLETSFDSVAGVRSIYLDGVLDIVILGGEHEYYKRTIALLLEAYLRAKKIRFYGKGSATLGTPDITGQKEPDESYNSRGLPPRYRNPGHPPLGMAALGTVGTSPPPEISHSRAIDPC